MLCCEIVPAPMNPIYARACRLGGPCPVILWWETRRLYYNAVVGVTGVIAGALMIVCALLAEPLVGTPIGLPDPPLFAVLGAILYGIMANVCYTGGWIVELLLRATRRGADTTAFARRALRVGVRFSVALTLLPAAVSWAVFGINLLLSRKMIVTEP